MLKWLKNLKPIMIENSKVPVILSRVAPIEIWAISFGIFVWCRGEMSETTKRHETIHFQQFLELGFIGFLVLYLWDWFIGLLKYRNGQIAYYEIRAEREAYDNDDDENYLATRKRWQWLKGDINDANV